MGHGNTAGLGELSTTVIQLHVFYCAFGVTFISSFYQIAQLFVTSYFPILGTQAACGLLAFTNLKVEVNFSPCGF